MASRRTVDTSAMFRSMTAHAEDGSEEKKTLLSAAQQAPEADAALGTEVKRQTKKKGSQRRQTDPSDRQSVKLGFYLTPRIYEAIQLHKAANFIGAHNDSQIVNKALAEYLKKEIEVLRSVDNSVPTEDRLRTAAAKMLADRR